MRQATLLEGHSTGVSSTKKQTKENRKKTNKPKTTQKPNANKKRAKPQKHTKPNKPQKTLTLQKWGLDLLKEPSITIQFILNYI